MSSKKGDLNVELGLQVLTVKFIRDHVEIECMCPRVMETIKFIVPRNDEVLERQLYFFVHNALTNPPKEG